MSITTPVELGATIRARRLELGLSQAELALSVGVRRQWVIGLEAGNANATLEHLLRCLSALGLGMSVGPFDISEARAKLGRIISGASGS